jgi:aryl-alcohol dehydrogenase-like predicted oxidoreductase
MSTETLTLGGEHVVHRLGYGAMRLTGKGVWGFPPDREEAKAVLRRALELGVDFIDTADAYGPDSSELVIAEALRPYPDGLLIATKGGHTRQGPSRWRPDGRPEHLRAACEASLCRLGLERIDLYQLHTVDPNVPIEESVGALEELRREGKIRFVGVSNVSVEQLDRARRVALIVSVQNRFNLGDRASQPVLEVCERDGLAFIPWSPRGPARAGAAGEQLAVTKGATVSQLALAWLLARSPAILPIPGTRSLEHLEENVAAASVELTPEELAVLEGASVPGPPAGDGTLRRVKRAARRILP